MSSSLYRRLHGLFNATATTSQHKTRKPTIPATLKPSPSDSSLSSKERKLKSLVNKFKKNSDSDHFRHRFYYYGATVSRLAAAKRFSDIEDILEHQKRYKDITDERFAVRLISLYGKSGMFDQAHKLFDEMPQLNCERTVMSFNALLAACVNSKKFDKIGEFFHELPEKLSVEPNTVSYNIVAKAFCETGSLDSALLLIEEMETNGLDPDLITFNTLLNAFYQNNRFSDAEKLWALMESKNVVPNVRSYNPKLRGLIADNRIPEAVELIEEMGRMGVKPDVFSFNALIKGFSDDGKLEEAKSWYCKIKKNDCAPDRATFAVLLPFVCDKGDFDFALELCKTAIVQRCLVDTAKMQRVVDGLSKELKIEDAKELVDIGRSSNYFHYKLKMPTDEFCNRFSDTV